MTEVMQSIIEFSQDIASAEAPKPLPAGKYLATIKSAVVHEGKNGKMAKIEWFISPDMFPVDFDTKEAPDGVTLTSYRPSLEDTTQSRFLLRRFLESINAPVSSHIDLTDWLGLEAEIETEVDVFEGVDRAQFKRVVSRV